MRKGQARTVGVAEERVSLIVDEIFLSKGCSLVENTSMLEVQ